MVRSSPMSFVPVILTLRTTNGTEYVVRIDDMKGTPAADDLGGDHR